MSESTLSLGYVQFMNAACSEYGMGPDYTAASVADQATLDEFVQDGYRTALSPPLVPNASTQHQWSFLRPVRTITTTAPYSTGTIAIVAGSLTTVTLTGGTWPAWAADGELLIDGVSYEVATRTSNAVIVLASNGPACSGESYSLERRYYTLDDDFGSFEGPITFPPQYSSKAIQIVGEGVLRQFRQTQTCLGRPTHAALTWVNSTSSTAGQRAQLEFFPSADAAYLLTYRCRVLPNKLTTTNPYPLGGMEFGQAVMSGTLAAVESHLFRARGTRYQEFIERITAAVAVDQRRSPEFFSYNAANSFVEVDGGFFPYTPHLVIYQGGNPY